MPGLAPDQRLGGLSPTSAIAPYDADGTKPAQRKPPGALHAQQLGSPPARASTNYSRKAVATTIGKAIDQQCSTYQTAPDVAAAAGTGKHTKNRSGLWTALRPSLLDTGKKMMLMISYKGKNDDVMRGWSKKQYSGAPPPAYFSRTVGTHFTCPHFSSRKSSMY